MMTNTPEYGQTELQRRLGNAYDPFCDPILVDPFPFFAEARAVPVFYSPRLDYWVVTRYRDCREVLQDSKRFSAVNTLDSIKPVCPHAREILQAGFRPVKTLTNADPPVHTRTRRLANAAFTRSGVAKWEGAIRELTRDYLDANFTNGRADIIADLGYRLPALVIFRIMGVPPESVPVAKAASSTRILFNWGYPTDEEQVKLARDSVDFWSFAEKLVAERARSPGDDFISALLQAREGELPALSEAEVTTILSATLTAGHETTTSAIGNAFRWLLAERHAWDEICADPALIPNAVEELLRIDPAVSSWRRRAIAEAEIGGVRVPAGANLLVLVASGNRDPEVFPDPDRLDIHRVNAREHIGFGYGAHICLGAPLARLELKVVLEEVSARLPGLRLVPAQRLEFLPNTSFRGPRALQVAWDVDQ